MCQTKVDLFDLNQPRDLYRILHEVYVEYVTNPTERSFLLLALGFTHLREWISDSNHNQIKKKKQRNEPLTDGEKFFEEIYDLQAFQVIQELCNRGKHHVTSGTKASTSKLEGIHCGISKFGDSFNQQYFLIDGHDSRDYFIVLINKYNEWFDRNG